MKKLRWLALLMGVTILGITGFQGYWLSDNYKREKQNLELKSNSDFHETILHLQASKLKLDRVNIQLDSLRGALGGVMLQSGKRSKHVDSLHRSRILPPI